MQYIVLDLEWNQAVTKEKIVRKPFPLHGEIIQIGAIKLSEELQELDTFKLMIKPQYYLKMNHAVKKLTGIRTGDLADGISFPEGIERFRAWCGDDVCFLTWGSDDAAMLMDNLKLWQMDLTWMPATYNLQNIFNQQITGEKRQWSLAGAMEKLGIPQENRAHDALNDAVNTAAIVRALDMNRGMAEYAADVLDKEGDSLRSQRYTGYPGRKEAVTDERLRLVTCPVCSQLMEGSGWLPQGRQRELAFFRCPEHGEFMVRLRFKRLRDGSYHAKSQLFTADETVKTAYLDGLAQQNSGIHV